jgi:hypothetical protein
MSRTHALPHSKAVALQRCTALFRCVFVFPRLSEFATAAWGVGCHAADAVTRACGVDVSGMCGWCSISRMLCALVSRARASHEEHNIVQWCDVLAASAFAAGAACPALKVG